MDSNRPTTRRRVDAARCGGSAPGCAAGFEVWTLAGGAEGDGVLFDSSHGDGETAFRRGNYKAILAGGISEKNLAQAFALQTDVIDVSGSLETSPGVKSIDRLHTFILSFRSRCRYFSRQ